MIEYYVIRDVVRNLVVHFVGKKEKLFKDELGNLVNRLKTDLRSLPEFVKSYIFVILCDLHEGDMISVGLHVYHLKRFIAKEIDILERFEVSDDNFGESILCTEHLSETQMSSSF